MTFLQKHGFRKLIVAEGELGGTALNIEKLRKVSDVKGNYSLKSKAPVTK